MSSISAQAKSHLTFDRTYVLRMPASDVTGSDVTVSEVIFPRFILTILVQNVPLRMTDMATGGDVSHVTPKGVPLEGWGPRMCNRKLRNIRSNVTRRASPERVGCAHARSEMPLGAL